MGIHLGPLDAVVMTTAGATHLVPVSDNSDVIVMGVTVTILPLVGQLHISLFHMRITDVTSDHIRRTDNSAQLVVRASFYLSLYINQLSNKSLYLLVKFQ